MRGNDNRGNAGTQARNQGIFHECAAAPGALQFAAKHPQNKHIEQQVKKAPVEEGIGDELPEKKSLPDENGNQTKDIGDHGSAGDFLGDKLKEKHRRAGNDNDFYCPGKRTAEAHLWPLVIGIHNETL